jgi:tetratricopeptide (TPR) repeat protein
MFAIIRQLIESVLRGPAADGAPVSVAEGALRRGLTFHESGRFGDAIDAYRRALALDGALPDAHEFLGRALVAAGEYAAAMAPLERALRDTPSSVHAHCARGFALLAMGDYLAGWPEYEWRWQRDEMQTIRGMFRQPWWNGASIDGKTLLLFAEQGFGDAIQFVRFAPVVASLSGARIALDCHPPLRRLFARVQGVAEVLESDGEIPRYELCFPLMSLPLLLRATTRDIPRDVPYLRASAEHAAKWQGHVRSDNGMRVGVVWASNPTMGSGWRKSLPLETLAPLASVPGVSFYSLQNDAGERASAGFELIDLTAQLTDFSETAGLIANLDLVISVDTAVAHLAGAMGKPTWLLLRQIADWRWQGQGSRSLWYPTMRVFRQEREGDWPSVVRQVELALREEAARRA